MDATDGVLGGGAAVSVVPVAGAVRGKGKSMPGVTGINLALVDGATGGVDLG